MGFGSDTVLEDTFDIVSFLRIKKLFRNMSLQMRITYFGIFLKFKDFSEKRVVSSVSYL